MNAPALLAEDLVRAERGLGPVCGRCHEPIRSPRTATYRCTDCKVPFHRGCAVEHFAEHGGGAPANELVDFDLARTMVREVARARKVADEVRYARMRHLGALRVAGGRR